MMARSKSEVTKLQNHELEPMATPEDRENQAISYAYDLAMQRMIAGTATSQEIVHFLKLGSSKNRLELEKLRNENELLRAKTEEIHSKQTMEEMYAGVLAAMKKYSGADYDDGEDYEDYEEFAKYKNY